VEGLNDNRFPRQHSLHSDDEVQVSEAHMCAQDPTNVVTSHPWPDVNVGTRKGPLPSAPTVGVLSKHQWVNLCYCSSRLDGALKRHKIYTGSGRISLRPVYGCCSCY
jgi:hypothetical protein